MFELTGAIDLVLQIMMAGKIRSAAIRLPFSSNVLFAVMVSKFTGDFFSKDGVYESESRPRRRTSDDLRTALIVPSFPAWINIRNYPFLNNKVEYRRDTILAKDVMTKAQEIVYMSDEGWTVDRIGGLSSCSFDRT